MSLEDLLSIPLGVWSVLCHIEVHSSHATKQYFAGLLRALDVPQGQDSSADNIPLYKSIYI